MGGNIIHKHLRGDDGAWSIAAHNQKPDKLFHATRAEITDIIKPMPGRTVTGEQGNFIFAGHDYISTHAYAIKTPDMMCIHYMPGFPNGDIHACIIRDRDKFMNQRIEGAIYEVPADKFRRIHFSNGEASHEWVAEEPVAIDPAKVTKVDLDSAMRAGVQVFFADADAHHSLVDQIYDPAWHEKRWGDSKLAAAWKSGKLIWENHLQGLNPFFNPAFASLRPILRA